MALRMVCTMDASRARMDGEPAQVLSFVAQNRVRRAVCTTY